MPEIQLFSALSAALEASAFKADPAAAAGFVPFADLMDGRMDAAPLPAAAGDETPREEDQADKELVANAVAGLLMMLEQAPAACPIALPANPPATAPSADRPTEEEIASPIKEAALPATGKEPSPVPVEAPAAKSEEPLPAAAPLHEAPKAPPAPMQDLSPAAPLQASAQAVPAPVSPPVQASLPSPVGTPRWREELGAEVRLLATERVQSAELRLEPAELGPVQVSLRIEDNEATLTLTAPHPETRQALEEALPQLREMLEAGGVQVGETSIGDSSASRDQPRDQPQPRRFHPVSQEQSPQRIVRADGLVDVFA